MRFDSSGEQRLGEKLEENALVRRIPSRMRRACRTWDGLGDHVPTISSSKPSTLVERLLAI